MVEYSLSLSKKSFGDIISLLEKEKRKYKEQYPAFPRKCTEIFKGGEIQTDSAEIRIAHSRQHFCSYLCSTNPSLPKKFPLSLKPL